MKAKRRAALPWTSADCCAGHRCDGCPKCQAGRCCRTDDHAYSLPAVGSWQPVFGTLGVRNTDGERVECHACGQWFRSLATHAWREHNLTANEYRACFGLTSKGLIADATAAKYRESLVDGRLRPFQGLNALQELTREQRAVNGSRRPIEATVNARRAATLTGRVKVPLSDGDPRHGSVYGYANAKCRCQPCRDAWAADHAAYMRRRRRERVTRPVDAMP